MKVILIKDLKGKAFAGDVIEVTPGYARNYLFPKRFATKATVPALQKAKTLQAERIKTQEEMAAKAEETIRVLGKVVLTFSKKTSKEGHLYGSVAEKDIVAALKKEAKMSFEKKQIEMPKGHIKSPGKHEVILHLFEGKTVPIVLKIEAEGDTEEKVSRSTKGKKEEKDETAEKKTKALEKKEKKK